MTNEKKHGGKRKGSGRPQLYNVEARIVILCEAEHKKELQNLLKEVANEFKLSKEKII